MAFYRQLTSPQGPKHQSSGITVVPKLYKLRFIRSQTSVASGMQTVSQFIFLIVLNDCGIIITVYLTSLAVFCNGLNLTGLFHNQYLNFGHWTLPIHQHLPSYMLVHPWCTPQTWHVAKQIKNITLHLGLGWKGVVQFSVLRALTNLAHPPRRPINNCSPSSSIAATTPLHAYHPTRWQSLTLAQLTILLDGGHSYTYTFLLTILLDGGHSYTYTFMLTILLDGGSHTKFTHIITLSA